MFTENLNTCFVLQVVHRVLRHQKASGGGDSPGRGILDGIRGLPKVLQGEIKTKLISLLVMDPILARARITTTLSSLQTLDICHLSHDVDQVITFHGRWEEGLNAGGVQRADFRNFAKNPQCFIRLGDPVRQYGYSNFPQIFKYEIFSLQDPSDPERRCSAVISLMQRREPKSRAKGLNKAIQQQSFPLYFLKKIKKNPFFPGWLQDLPRRRYRGGAELSVLLLQETRQPAQVRRKDAHLAGMEISHNF